MSQTKPTLIGALTPLSTSISLMGVHVPLISVFSNRIDSSLVTLLADMSHFIQHSVARYD